MLMPYVKRNSAGKVIAVYSEPVEDGLEEVALNNADLEAFLIDDVAVADSDRALMRSDLELARVLEDLIEILIDKNVISFTDLPTAAQSKLLRRHGLRTEFAYVRSLFADEPDGGDGEEIEIHIDDDIVMTDPQET
ncbi:MAG: hypothetical protein KDM81_19375 [Verrucomicrobiae bacterium]|nr:hypothetical protein [Verrucomicrobiae bacterium]